MGNRVVVTGLGVISCAGTGIEENWANVISGNSGIGEITQFDPEMTPIKMAGEVKGFKPKEFINDRKSLKVMYRNVKLGLAAAKMAIDNSGLDVEKVDPLRFGSFTGSGGGGFDEGPGNKDLAPVIKAAWNENIKDFDALKFGSDGIDKLYPLWLLKTLPNNLFCYISIYYNAQGVNDNIISSFTGGAQAIGDGFNAIKRDDADVILAGGYDTLIMPNNITSFCDLNLMPKNGTTKASFRPFDKNRDGFLVGEGAGIVLLEELSHAQKRGAKIYGEIVGYGNASNAFDFCKPVPDGKGLSLAIKMALRNSGLNPDDIGYINADGIGTTESDRAETLAVKNVFGDHAYKLTMSSTKPVTAHVGAASGAIELIISTFAIENGIVPPTINLENPDKECDLNYCALTACEKKVDAALSLNQGFGGHNSALIVKKFE